MTNERHQGINANQKVSQLNYSHEAGESNPRPEFTLSLICEFGISEALSHYTCFYYIYELMLKIPDDEERTSKTLNRYESKGVMPSLNC